MSEPISKPQAPELDQEITEFDTIRSATPRDRVFRDPLPRAVSSFLKYIAEDQSAYQVRTRSRQLIEVAKRRAPRDLYPPAKPSPLRSAYRWLILAAVGLAFSGLGALLLAPIAGILAWQTKKTHLSKADEGRARLVILLSILLMTIGAGLAYLFWLHVRG